jgi:RimJ/RimL family protein N-acetyltransferase
MVTYSAIDNTITLDKTRSKYMTILYTISLCEPEDAKSYFKMYEKSWLATYPNRKKGITKKALMIKLNASKINDRIDKLTKLIEEDKKPFFYVLKIEDKVIGMFDLTITKKNIGEIKMLYLDPSFFGQGFGHDMINFAFDTFKANGCKKVIVKVVDYNTRAINFYLRQGFKVTSILPDAFDILDGVSLTMLEMTKKL